MRLLNKGIVSALSECERSCQSAERMLIIFTRISKEGKLLLRSLESLNKSTILLILAIMKNKNIHNIKNKDKKVDIFFKKYAKPYNLSTKEILQLKKLLFLAKKHNESGFEFFKAGKMVILDDSLKTYELESENIREFILVLRRFVEFVKQRIEVQDVLNRTKMNARKI